MKQEDTMSEPKQNEPTMSESSEQNEPTMSEETEQSGSAASAPAEKKRKVLPILCAILLAVIFLCGGFLGGWYLALGNFDERARDLIWLAERVEENYYLELDDDELYDKLFHALELDKYCSYYNPSAYDRLVDESKGSNEGYGVSLVYEDYARVARVVYNSPCERAGMETGMYIYRFGESAETLREGTPEETYAFLTSHDSVVLEFGYADGEKQVGTVARESYAGSYCEYRDSDGSFRFRGGDTLTLTQIGGGMSALDGKTAYLRLTEFDGRAAEEFEACLEMMRERGRTDLVLDLRSNGGGYLSTLCEIAAHLLKNAEGNSPLVAVARYRDGKTEEYTADGNDFGTYFSADSRIRVLGDESTASASEALIGAMLDYGTITQDDIYLRVSTYNGQEVAKTYGKGVMQSTFTAPGGRALRLTVAEILWPKGNSIHDVGIRAYGDHAVHAEKLAGAEEFLRLI